jgi:hypothetical protein
MRFQDIFSYRRIKMATLVLAVFSPIALISPPAEATTKGLNQIVTPDIQPQGQLSFSVQQQDPNIGNRLELQTELGITKQFEIALFEGTSAAEQVANIEIGLLNKGPYLLSTGFLDWNTKGGAPQPFLEGGYYVKDVELMAGVIRTPSQDANGNIQNYKQTQAILGGAYHVGPRLLVQVDYQSGGNNFSTAGFTYSISPEVTLNPAVYISNASPHSAYGYAVLTWSLQAFK